MPGSRRREHEAHWRTAFGGESSRINDLFESLLEADVPRVEDHLITACQPKCARVSSIGIVG